MRKIYLTVSFLLLGFLYGRSQEGLALFTASYFRADPFSVEFSSFLKRLINDPEINNKTLLKRTDSSFFYFSGIYHHYNPFFFIPSRIEIVLKESSITYSDSLPFTDTIFEYQLRAYTSGDAKGLQEVKKEADKINRQYRNKFIDKNTEEFGEGTTTGGVRNYFLPYYGLSPLSIIWGRLAEKNECVLTIVVRMKTSENMAILAAPLNNP